ncbi:MAG: NAD-dependent epimerase/dehydratase family protein [Polynucleobacter sp.]|nr:NAD-dependent epimerase/dehydratase family protein [Polynucleobacter sp.]
MKVLITGANGFVGQNLRLHLLNRKDIEIVFFTRTQESAQFPELLKTIDFVFHLAGSNRPLDPAEFITGNVLLTQELCNAVASVAVETDKKIPIVFTSSTQYNNDNAYGDSKRSAEKVLFQLREKYQIPVYVFRLPNVFGKWCKPNYNSVVATFCHNVARDIPLKINDPDVLLTLAYVDDVVKRFIEIMDGAVLDLDSEGFVGVGPKYTTTVGELAQHIESFKNSRSTLQTDRVGVGLIRALYSTYISYLPKNLFNYPVPSHEDDRGIFVEMLKTPDCGQFSYFTAHPGVTRGGHYHHSKTEKFLVIKGKALFRFQHMLNHEIFELLISGDSPSIVETIPGWAHDITNIGDDEMLVMLWANEIFDRTNPDTFSCPL